MTAVPPRPAAFAKCKCGHTADRHAGGIKTPTHDPCVGGTLGFCGCPYYRPAAPSVIREVPAACICADEDDCPSCPVCTRPATPDATAGDGESLARRFHETYERLAPEFGYETRRESAVPWEQVPEANRSLMIAVCRDVLAAAARDAELRKRVEALAEDDESVAVMAREHEAKAKIIGEQSYWHTLAGVREQSAARLHQALDPS